MTGWSSTVLVPQHRYHSSCYLEYQSAASIRVKLGQILMRSPGNPFISWWRWSSQQGTRESKLAQSGWNSERKSSRWMYVYIVFKSQHALQTESKVSVAIASWGQFLSLLEISHRESLAQGTGLQSYQLPKWVNFTFFYVLNRIAKSEFLKAFKWVDNVYASPLGNL